MMRYLAYCVVLCGLFLDIMYVALNTQNYCVWLFDGRWQLWILLLNKEAGLTFSAAEIQQEHSLSDEAINKAQCVELPKKIFFKKCQGLQDVATAFNSTLAG